MIKVNFPYDEFDEVNIPEKNLVKIIEPEASEVLKSEEALIDEGLNNPVGGSSLENELHRKDRVLILVDDYTRSTPTDVILPVLLEKIHKIGVKKENVKLLVASGTHRSMTEKEKRIKYGKEIVEKYTIMDHLWRDKSNLKYLSTTENGIDIWINKEMLKADFVIGIGHIAPHRVAGFGGGSKIVQPGICGPITTGQTHWISACFEGFEITGKIDNPVRKEINEVGEIAGLDFIINTVHGNSGNLEKCICGHPVEAHRKGCEIAFQVYSASLPKRGDIVVADSFPADVDFWQAVKGIFSADLALKPGGVIVLVTPCKEGVTGDHPEINEIGYRGFREVKKMVDDEKIEDLTLASHIAHVGRIVKDKGSCVLVSSGINRQTAVKLGLDYAETPRMGLKKALNKIGKDAEIVVIKNGGEILPKIEGEKNHEN